MTPTPEAAHLVRETIRPSADDVGCRMHPHQTVHANPAKKFILRTILLGDRQICLFPKKFPLFSALLLFLIEHLHFALEIELHSAW